MRDVVEAHERRPGDRRPKDGRGKRDLARLAARLLVTVHHRLASVVDRRFTLGGVGEHQGRRSRLEEQLWRGCDTPDSGVAPTSNGAPNSGPGRSVSTPRTLP